MSSSSATAGGPGCRQLILHRLHLDPRKSKLLEGLSVEVIHTRSVRETIELAQRSPTAVVVVDLTTGGNAPERIASALRTDPAGSSKLIGCIQRPAYGGSNRASALGLKYVFVWPEGVFSELLQRFAVSLNIRMARVAERASIHQPLEPAEGTLHGRILNISVSGALVETPERAAHGDRLFLRLSLPPSDQVVTLHCIVCWAQPAGQKNHLGIEFVDGLTHEQKRQLTEFIRRYNMVSVEPPVTHTPTSSRRLTAPTKVRARLLDSKRTDYFNLLGSGEVGTYLLVPARRFHVPYRTGDVLELTYYAEPKAKREHVRILERYWPDSSRVDGRIGWRVQRLTAHQGASAAHATNEPA